MVFVLLLPWDFVAYSKTTISQEEDIFNHFLKPFLDKSEIVYTYNFNPFQKPISAIQPCDLKALSEVSEGWYIEYKKEPVSPKDIAKQLSAFANQFGGWLFFGIAENSEGTRTAGSFPGIHTSQVSHLLLHIREAATTHVRPEINYEYSVLNGPCDEIGLNEGHAIIVVAIAEGINPPYIHSSGRIYRRLSDKSEPETDRHALDMLWEKSRKTKESLSDFVSRIPDLSQAEEKATWAHIFLLPDPYFQKSPLPLTFERFCSVMGCKDGHNRLSIEMDNFFPSPGGYIARGTKGNNPFGLGVTLRWWASGNARLTIPINIYDRASFQNEIERFSQAEAFLQLLETQGFETVRIADFSSFLYVTAALINQYRTLLEDTESKETVFSRVVLQNTWRISPYIDDQKYLEQVANTGIPVVEDEDISIPRMPDLNSFIALDFMAPPMEIQGFPESFTNQLSALTFCLPVVYPILEFVGIIHAPEQLIKYLDFFSGKTVPKGR